jgi:hypothetical protein
MGNFSSFVLVRVVRLTVETNALTGTCLNPYISVHLTSCLATLAIASLVLYVAFPVSRTKIHRDPSIGLITLSTE